MKRIHRINEHGVSLSEMTDFSTIDMATFHFAQSAEDIELLRLFYQKKSGFYVDIGAYHPRQYSNTFLLHHLYGWRGINIDISPEAIELFDKSRPTDINIVAAVGRKAKKTYYSFEAAARNTLSSKNLQRQLSSGDTKLKEKHTVNVTPLADILRENLPDNTPIDVLDLDVEGWEKEVLESNDWSVFRPLIIVIEDYEVRNGGLLKSPLYKYLRGKKYEFIGHHFDTSFYRDATQSDPPAHLGDISRSEFISNLQQTNKKLADPLLREQREKSTDAIISELERTQAKVVQQQQKIKDLETSVSWAITKPLRYMSSKLRKIH